MSVSDQGMSKKTTPRKKRRVLAPSQKYEMWVALLSGQATQREVALKYGVDRSTVVSVCKAAKTGALTALAARPGRPGMTPEQVELAEARAEVERLKATVTEQAVALHLHQGKVSVCAVAQARSGLKMGVWSPADVVAPWSG